ncbi:hypothetical protein [Pseudalkalibacillus decolorationis]|uniref:UPF0738 family protein n=1 Tax=Pseudalkalibacillus decolorationis TaxID=163879 RepID=UPI002149212F|nr:hypothetical protein [Pseudalkalibacillus decolorationis]
MTTRLEVNSTSKHDGYIQFNCNSDELNRDIELHPSEQVLVDSDTLAFIYILDTPNDFVYVSFPKEHWGELKDAINQSKETRLHLTNHPDLSLEGLKPELEYLIENIKGNANYGNEMMKSVESVFLSEEVN